ncbi:uncharacterized protein [Onthophagus taurus]|uniref:uncharacterized protein n=1 Tax=Onthophagus taurus TaxID=166361 RepID=UPI0039BDE7EF
MKKMKVSCAAQIFSHTTAAVISYMAKSNATDITGTVVMATHAQDTAVILKFFDQLFDSFNGGSCRAPPGKILRSAVTKSSRHLLFWRDARENLEKMYFQQEGTQEKIIPPSLKNFQNNITCFKELTEELLGRGFSFYLPRTFNQDSLENYFAQVRQHRLRNNNPTPKQFGDTYKTLLIRKMVSTHSVGANCEETFDSSLLQLKDFLSTQAHNIEDQQYSTKFNSSDFILSKFNKRRIDTAAIGYVSDL